MSNLNYLIEPVRDELLNRMCQPDEVVGDCLFLGPGAPAQGPVGVGNFTAVSGIDAERLGATADASLDCLVINLALHWLGFRTQLAQVMRVLRPGGRFLFSLPGPDTLQVTRRAWAEVDSWPHIHDFEDMHTFGDALVAAGFQQAVVDADWIRVDYPGANALLADLRGAGMTCVHPHRRRTLTAKGRIAGFRSAFEQAGQDGLVTETFEVIYGAATWPGPRPSAAQHGVKVKPPGS